MASSNQRCKWAIALCPVALFNTSADMTDTDHYLREERILMGYLYDHF